MSNQPRLFREVTLKSAIKVLQDMKLPIHGAEITPEGLVRVLTSPVSTAPIEEANPFDRPLKRDRRQPKAS